MSTFRTRAWVAVVAALAASPAFAQYAGSTGATGTTRSTSSTGGISSGGSAPTGMGGGGGSNGSFGGSSLTTQQFQSMDAVTSPTGTNTTSLQKSNFLAGYYSNPYYQGLLSNNTAGKVAAPGGFGMTLYGTTTGGTGTVTGGRAGTTGLTTGLGGRTGMSSASQQSGILIPLPVQIAYTAQMQFPTPPVAPARLQADLRGVLNTGGLATPQAVQIVMSGNNVILRGTVKDDDERRLVEGLVRITPGVGAIVNELTHPAANR